MKISESWLREWVEFDAQTEQLAEALTNSGLEVDSILPAAGAFSGVVVGKITQIEPHPGADKLRVCSVEAGEAEPAQIVCGASNVYAGMHAPVARVGARLPGDIKIRKTKLRGVQSHGMLCSARELGFGDDHSGIMDLQGAGAPGADLRELLALDDQIIDVDLTPNRGDCLGMEGIAREVAAAFKADFRPAGMTAAAISSQARLDVEIEAPEACPRYAGRVVEGIDADAKTPLWMQERLRRGGIRPIHPLVDITNYVMLELGQPMHAFDLTELNGGIRVRHAEEGEKLTLLDGQEVTLSSRVTVIADHQRALAIAGVMGGEGSGVRDDTSNVFLESAFFEPRLLAGVARSFGLHTDASHRFERGADPTLQERALERATELVLEIAGGKAGPLTVAESAAHVPGRAAVVLRARRLSRLLGKQIPVAEVTEIFERLGMAVDADEQGWRVTPPGFRFDIEIEEDLVEEVARIHGYGQIPETPGQATLKISPRSREQLPLARLKDQLVSRGYSEAITYSFVDAKLQQRLFPEISGIALKNPIAENLGIMRVSLWPGLLGAAQTNVNHRQAYIRLFESGMRFIPQDNDIQQDNVLSGLIMGRRYPEQWGLGDEPVDFYDAKGDVLALLALCGSATNFMFKQSTHPALHPGRCASVHSGDQVVGWLGELHPAIASDHGFSAAPQLFELQLDKITTLELPEIKEVSKYPEIRRDLAILVDESVTAEQIESVAFEEQPEALKVVRFFDVYRGKNIDSGLKSIALGLILQDSSRTLTDEHADAVVADVIARLKNKLRARIRG